MITNADGELNHLGDGEPDHFDKLIEGSSLGTAGARSLRNRTPPAQAAKLVDEVSFFGAAGSEKRSQRTFLADRQSSSPEGGWPSNSLLGRLRARSRDGLLNLGTPITYGPRQSVIRQGEDTRYVLLLLSGCVKVVVHTEIGRDLLVGMRGAGEMVGEMALLADDERSANVITATPVRARLIKGVELLELMEHNTELCVLVARMITERLRFADRRRVEFIACPAPERVGRVLVELVDQYGTHSSEGWRLRIPLNQAEIASLAGVALSTVEKALQSMQRRAMLRRRYRHFVITDLARLRAFSGLPERHPY